MDFTIEEYNEVIHLTIIEETDTLEFSIEETVEELNLVIEEYHGADGAKGEKPNHQWNGTSLRFENPDDTWGNYVDLKGDKGDYGGGLMSVVAGDNITIDNTDPLNPIINAEDGGTTVTKTSDLINDGSDGLNPYISLNDIPEVDISTKAEVDASNLTPTNVISWRDALSIYSKSQVDGFVNSLSNDLDTEIVNRALADGALQSQINTINTRTSSVVDKMLHYWDATAGKWLSSGLNQVSSTLLEFAGRFKIKGLLIDETTDAIQPLEIKVRNNKLKFARNDGIERNILLDTDSVFNFDQFISSYFTDDLAIMRPLQLNSTNYFNWNWYSGGIFQAGQSRLDNGINSILYSSNGATLGRVHGNTLMPRIGNTFRLFRKFSIDTAISTQRVFVGFSDNWRPPGANPSNVAMSTLMGIIGYCMESGNPNILLIHNDLTGSATLVDTGFVHNIKYVYEITFSHNYGESFITTRLRRINKENGVVEDWNYTINGDYPPPTHPVLSPAIWCVDELNTATVKVLDYGVMQMHRIPYL